jgi:hypothetical protein
VRKIPGRRSKIISFKKNIIDSLGQYFEVLSFRLGRYRPGIHHMAPSRSNTIRQLRSHFKIRSNGEFRTPELRSKM